MKKLNSRIKKGDTVIAVTGKDKGKSGKVLKIFHQKSTLIVEGINFAKKHMRKTKQDQEGGIMHRESPIKMSNVAIQCRSCNKPTRIGVTVLSDGTKSRFCKKCKEIIQ